MANSKSELIHQLCRWSLIRRVPTHNPSFVLNQVQSLRGEIPRCVKVHQNHRPVKSPYTSSPPHLVTHRPGPASVASMRGWATMEPRPVVTLSRVHAVGTTAVSEQLHQPDGLNRRQIARLEEHVRRGQLMSPDHLLQAAYAHLEDIQGLHVQRPEVDAATAEAICHVLDRIVSEWDTFTPVEQSWLRGALRYFSKSHDDYPDLERGGFDDDLEVLNACLRYVHRQAWVLRPGDSAS